MHIYIEIKIFLHKIFFDAGRESPLGRESPIYRELPLGKESPLGRESTLGGESPLVREWVNSSPQKT